MVLYTVVTDAKPYPSYSTISKMFSAWLSLDRRRLGLTPNTRATASVRLGRASLFKSQPLRPWVTRSVDANHPKR